MPFQFQRTPFAIKSVIVIIGFALLPWHLMGRPSSAFATGGDPDFLLSVVLLDMQDGNLQDDIRVQVLIPGQTDTVGITTKMGFFSLDLTGKAALADSVQIIVPYQEFGENGEHLYMQRTFTIPLREARNLQLHVDFVNNPSAPLSYVSILPVPKLENNYQRDPKALTPKVPEGFQPGDKQARKALKAQEAARKQAQSTSKVNSR